MKPLLKAENAQAYKKLAEKGIMVAHPVSVMGQKQRPDNGISYHSTIKFFNPDKDTASSIHGVAKNLNFVPPDPRKTRIEPGMFKDRMGNDVYVIKLHGEHADQIKNNNKKFDHMGYKASFEFQPHVSVDKATWQKIVDSKAQNAYEAGITFGPAELRQGHSVLATYHHKPAISLSSPGAPKEVNVEHRKLAASEDIKEDLQKGIINQLTPIIGLAAAVVGGGSAQSIAVSPSEHSRDGYTHEKMLRTISDVESSGGKFANHRMLGGMHGEERAYGKYGLTPHVIRETIKMHRDLSGHKKASNLQGDDLHHYMQDNPGLEDQIASRHLRRLEHHFGQDPVKIGYGWLNGITGTYKAGRNKEDLDNHWHVLKIKKNFQREN